MRRIVTVTAAATGAAADVELEVGGDETLGAVSCDLERVVGSRGPVAAQDGRLLDPRMALRDLPEGSALTIGGASPCQGVAASVALVEVLAGPDAGRELRLPAGRHRLGREGVLASTDPSVSAHHVDVVAGGDGTIAVVDAGSRNGAAIGSRRLPAKVTVPWPPGETLRIGNTRLVHGREALVGEAATTGRGNYVVNPPPRLADASAPVTVHFPRHPEPTKPARLPLLASLAPLAAGLLLAVVLRRWEFAAFALMSPLVVLAQAVGDRWSTRKSNRSAAADHAAATARAAAELEAALDGESRHRHEQAPDLAQVAAAATRRTPLLWQRRAGDADLLTVRLGLGDVRAATTVEGPEAGAPLLRDVPVCLDLSRTKTLGIRGAGDVTVAVARSLLVQLVVLAPPQALRVVVLAPGRWSPWSWTRWLPHVRGVQCRSAVATTATQVRARLDELLHQQPSQAAPTPHTVVVVHGVSDTGISDALASRPDTSVLWVGGDDGPLPGACDAVLDATLPGSVVRRRGTSDATVVLDLVGADVADRVGRALAPVRTGGDPASSTVPSVVRWSSLYDVDPGDPQGAAADVTRRWRAGPTMAVRLGVGDRGPLTLDLERDGPHVLVAGTTGSGKSELLQSLVASLVLGSSPADLNLLLVDFKGGAAFGPCASLPHTLALLTDLDQASTARALASLSAELRRRERLFADAGVADLGGWRSAPAERDPLPRLVIVVDEFATLVEELPDFVGGLVGIAQRGRSLGVHLVLATQRPEGAVSADIRANTRIRICLAVAREAESRDVVDSPVAAAISHLTPGRAVVRVAGHALREVQTALVTAPWAPLSPRVRIVPPVGWGDPPVVPPAAETRATDLDLLVAAARAATSDVEPPSRTPWLAPLPEQLSLSDAPAPSTPAALPIGLVDLPDEQLQPALEMNLDDCDPVLVAGGARSGRTSAVAVLATALAAALSPDDLHIYAIDSGRGLQLLADLPHTGAVVEARDTERVERLLTHLTGELERRRGGGAGTDEPGAPQLLLVVDSWDGLLAAASDADAGRCQDALLRLAATGASGRLRLVVTGDRSCLTGRLGATVSTKLCLRLADRADYALLGLPPRQVPSSLPDGRCVRTPDLAWAQLATLDDLTRAAARRRVAQARPPRRFDPLPSRVPLHTVACGGTAVVVGIRGDDLVPLLLDPDDAGALLVAGPARSGRSTTLVTLAAQLAGRHVLGMCPRGGPLHQRRDLARVVDPSDATAAEAAVAAVQGGAVLLVDDVDVIDDATTLDTLETAVRRAREGRGFVVLAGATDAMTATFRGPVAQARRSRAGLLLKPDGPHDGELLGVRLRRRSGATDPPGRGILALHGVAVPVQVPDPS